MGIHGLTLHPKAAAAAVLLLAACHAPPRDRVGNPETPAPLPGPVPDLDARRGPMYRDETRHTSARPPARDDQASVTPDGAWMAYVTDSNSEQRDVYFKPVSGTRTTRLTFDLADDLFPRVSPDGRQVAFCSNRHGNWDILVVSVDRPSAVMQVTMGPEDEIHPSWSGDGTKLVYCASPRRGEWELRIADLRSGAQTTLGPGIFPDWNPVDNRIAFQFPKARPGEGWSGIWTVDAMGEGGPTQLVSAEFFDDGQWGAINPAWSPDGEWIAFSTVHQSPVAVWEKRLFEADDIWLVRADGSKVTVRITDSPEPEWHPAWGGRGARQRLFFTRREGGRQTIWSVQPILFPFAASPDGAAASAGR